MPRALVTGASKGIGRSIALNLDRQGWTVFAGVRRPEDGDALCKDGSNRLQPLILDITKADQIAQAAKTIAQAVGEAGLDALVNNAGIALAAPLEFIPIPVFREQIEVNLTGHLAVTQAMLPFVRKAKGRIINISSIGGRIAGPMLGPYHASKFAIEGLSDSLRAELSPWDIKVVSIEPGAIATPIWETATAAADKLEAGMPEQGRAYYSKQIARTRKGSAKAATEGIHPDRVAEVVDKALKTPNPRNRYTVGQDAWFVANVLLRLPERIRGRVARRLG